MGEVNLTVIGGGLAGSEAAWQAAERGLKVRLYEMRPNVKTGAHESNYLAELVCSNSLGSDLPDRAGGLLKNELRRLNCLLLRLAGETAVPAGGALAVDREAFARRVSEVIEAHPNIDVVREEVRDIPAGLTVVASGPLTSATLSESIRALSGEEHLYFFDAIAPIVEAESIDMSVAFRASRYERGDQEDGDYVNCPMTEEEYRAFVGALRAAERIELKSFEEVIEHEGVKAGAHTFFEGCLPVEIIAQRGEDSLAFGPLRPVGLIDPRTGRRPFAVVQLRQDNLAGTMYNLVGFQTNLTFTEQRRVLKMIPGLGAARFLRYGQMHRNTFIYAPKLLRATLQWHDRDDLLFAGQITGIEGYVGNIASGLLAGWNAARVWRGEKPVTLPPTTMLGALCHYVTHAAEADFQPMKANFGVMPELTGKKVKGKRERAKAYAERALADLDRMLESVALA
ncbi:MAG: methylenetetrahydrofolate--tRNA-(uracil(54)-C(5))-methyltransferase (FADH(2)-oxidizing) TrmFO [Anaerolineae bacterium]|nr:MAG: methylenetetrahydrofolate--tRNA-(uracil(54)-C(5))-methyltransferase (FADH(2)-oxidizing) TrmFO [Anaerolineae bacterium]